jgi:hypothetical protein
MKKLTKTYYKAVFNNDLLNIRRQGNEVIRCLFALSISIKVCRYLIIG